MNVYTLLYIKKKTDTYTYDHTLYIYNTSKIQEHTKKIHTEIKIQYLQYTFKKTTRYSTIQKIIKNLPYIFFAFYIFIIPI